MNSYKISQTDPRYPTVLTRLMGAEAPQNLWAIGNAYLLTGRMLALFSAATSPEELAVHAYLLAQHMRNSSIALVTGFETPVEEACLKIALDSSQPIVFCAAREIDSMRISEQFKVAIELGRLLIISAFNEGGKPSAQKLRYRDRIVGALADQILVVYAESDAKSEEFFNEIAKVWHKPLYTFSNSSNKANRKLVALGAQPIFPDHNFK
ncbi:MAG TPA: DNA-processing protein DprA [Candidatus Acidoferrales bacterium]|nr:DNA-processing protein DprA [Candidatus Acidoferrales bacterium]